MVPMMNTIPAIAKKATTTFKATYKRHGKEIRAKKEQTSLKNYCLKNPNLHEDVKAKIVATNMRVRNVPYPMQDPEVFAKSQQTRFSKKSFEWPSGKVTTYQGFEHFALCDLLKSISEDDIENEPSKVPPIWYNDEKGKRRRYYMDIFIKVCWKVYIDMIK